MRNAAANLNGTACYTTLLSDCKHSRLREALAVGLAPAPRQVNTAVQSAENAQGVSPATTAYAWVAGMSLVSLLSVVVSGTMAG
jgi:hypothetical protein